MTNSLLAELQRRAQAIKSGRVAVPVPTYNGANTNSLDLALARCAAAEENLESARASARAVAKAQGVKISGLFSESRFIRRESGERWADEARAEGHEQGGKEMIAMYAKINAPPSPEYVALGRAVRAAVARGELKGFFGTPRGNTPADGKETEAAEEAAEAAAAAEVEARAKINAEKIFAAARLRDSGGPPLPEPTGKAKRILDAAKAAHRKQGDD
jgi:hypothetical protein